VLLRIIFRNKLYYIVGVILYIFRPLFLKFHKKILIKLSFILALHEGSEVCSDQKYREGNDCKSQSFKYKTHSYTFISLVNRFKFFVHFPL
jgi:hypothetical protein